jgi:hypothetical protein
LLQSCDVVTKRSSPTNWHLWPMVLVSNFIHPNHLLPSSIEAMDIVYPFVPVFHQLLTVISLPLLLWKTYFSFAIP